MARFFLEFLVGILLIIVGAIFFGLALLLIPILMLMGFFLRLFIGLLMVLISVWLIGKVSMICWVRLSNRQARRLE